MYCIQWLLPVLLIPKPAYPAMVNTQVMFLLLYLFSFFLERKPCTVCTGLFIFTVVLLCYSGIGNCILWSNLFDGMRCENG